jgi:two-component system response regulator CpxR
MQAGLQVTLCGNGRLAVQEIARTRFDLLLMDVAMPAMDGFSALHHIRRTSDTPVIMLTSRIAAADRVHGLDRGG